MSRRMSGREYKYSSNLSVCLSVCLSKIYTTNMRISDSAAMLYYNT